MGAKFNNGRSKQDYGTPPEFLSKVYRRLGIHGFDWDLAASPENSVAPFLFTEEDNSLIQDWDECYGWLWLNPPFANIEPWVKKASECKESKIALLVPASVGANWWRDYVHNKAHVLFLNGRLTFVGETQPYPKDCALLIYTPYVKGGYEVWNWRER